MNKKDFLINILKKISVPFVVLFTLFYFFIYRISITPTDTPEEYPEADEVLNSLSATPELENTTAPEKQKTPEVCVREKCFKVEIADEYDERMRGLMFRSEMPEDKGMIFIYPGEGNYRFWMKNTLIPLDMAWISGDKKIIYIERMAAPCKTNSCPSYGPPAGGGLARFVLEINGGLADKYGIAIGDIVDLKLGQ